MKRKHFIALCALAVLIYPVAGYLNSQYSPGYEELLKGLESCGTFIQAGFKGTTRGHSDYFIVLLSVAVVLLTLVYSIKYLIKPGEGAGHIKHKILNYEC